MLTAKHRHWKYWTSKQIATISSIKQIYTTKCTILDQIQVRSNQAATEYSSAFLHSANFHTRVRLLEGNHWFLGKFRWKLPVADSVHFDRWNLIQHDHLRLDVFHLKVETVIEETELLIELNSLWKLFGLQYKQTIHITFSEIRN